MEIEKEITEYENGIKSVTYYKKGDPLYWHNDDGPARIWYDSKGKIIEYVYYINDKQLTEEEWKREYGWKLLLKGSPMGDLY